MNKNIYEIELKDINANLTNLGQYKNQYLLIVNVASKCGFTSQYKGLEKVYQELKEKGLQVLGFPCNQFGAQEPGDEKEIQQFCSLTYQVSFPMFSKIEVNGTNTHELYNILKNEAPGILGSKAIKWNFTKFLIDKEGNVIKRFAPKDTPEQIKEFIIQEMS